MSLYKELKRFHKKDRISFHIPGHKFGYGLSRGFKKNIFITDVTEFSETDDLQHPVGILKKGQDYLAKTFGTDGSFYLTNGSSLGLHAAIVGSVKKGDKILVDRTCHKAVASALIMSGAEPVYVYPDFNDDLELYTGVTVKAVKKAVQDNPDVAGAIIVSPTYYGICSDIKGIADYLHSMGKFLITDEAHGAHLEFSDKLPVTAIKQGSDISVQSAHKTLPALGQASILHINKASVVPKESILKSLRLLQTTSPSYMLMSSIDEAVRYMRHKGKKRLDKLIDRIEALKERVNKKGVLEFIGFKNTSRPQDTTRVTVDFIKSGLSGTDAAQILKDRFSIYPEMADGRYVVFICTVANRDKDIKRLEEALLSFEKGEIECRLPETALPSVTMGMPPREAWMAESEEISFYDGEGRVSADIVAVCPPGAALLIPGQVIDKETIEFLTFRDISEKIKVVKK